jgi:hypothetical protein
VPSFCVKLLPSPSWEQGAGDRETVVRQGRRPRGLRQRRRKDLPGDVTLEQALAVLREGVQRLYTVVETQADEPADQRVVFELLDEHALAAHGKERLG